MSIMFLFSIQIDFNQKTGKIDIVNIKSNPSLPDCICYRYRCGHSVSALIGRYSHCILSMQNV